MYLTRMELDLTKRETRMALASPARFHGAVEHTSAEKGGKLWRLDALNGKKYLLLVSKDRPNLADAAEQFGMESGWQTLDYTHFLEQLQNGQHRRFRLKANPVITKSAGSGNRGKVLAHLTPEQQMQWLLTRAEKFGFSLKADEFTVTESAWENFHKGTDERRTVTFHTAVFEGVLTVTNADLLRQSLCEGIGREKAYGCGLLTVTRRIE